MSIILHILDADGTLIRYKKLITDTFQSGLAKIIQVLPTEKVDVAVHNNPSAIIPELGMSGHAYGPNFVVLAIDGNRKDCQQVIVSQLSGILAHELHHALRWQKIGYGKTLLESMITEGLATHFEREITGVIQPWATALKDKQIILWLAKAKPEFNSKQYDHHAWFYGSKERKIPRWAGYTLGYKLVSDYLGKHPQEKTSQLYAMKAKEFV